MTRLLEAAVVACRRSPSVVTARSPDETSRISAATRPGGEDARADTVDPDAVHAVRGKCRSAKR